MRLAAEAVRSPRGQGGRFAFASASFAVAILIALLVVSSDAGAEEVTGSVTPTEAGTAKTVTFPAPGDHAALSVPVGAGESVSIVSSEASVSGTYRLDWLNPKGEYVRTWTPSGESGGFFEPVRFAEAGTAELLIDPKGTATGSITFTLYDASDRTGSISTAGGGETKTFTIGAPGQRQLVRFQGTEGQHVSLVPSNAGLEGEFHVDTPAGVSLEGSGGTLQATHGPLTLPETGTYTVVLTGDGAQAGSVALGIHAPTGPPVGAARGPVAAYSFDEGEGTVLHDLTGDGNEGTIEAPATWTKGRYGDALWFGGNDGGCVTVPDSPTLGLGEEFTIEAWVKSKYLGNEPIVYKEEGGSASYALGIGLDQFGKAEAWASGGEGGQWEVVSPHPVELNVWTHLAVTYDGAQLHLYVDGEEVATKAVAGLDLASEGPLRIGCAPPLGDTFYGEIDELRLYERSLSTAEVGADMETPLQTPRSGPVAAWSFDEGEGNTAEDLTGHGHTATIANATWTRGRFGDGLRFAGRKSCVSVANSPELDFTEEFTLEAWVRPGGSGKEAGPLIVQSDPGAGSGAERYAYYLLGGVGEVPQAWIRKGLSGHAGIYGTEPLPKGTWSHVTLTDDGAHLRLYIDGVLVRTASSPVLTTGDGPLQIGCGVFGDHFEGRIDEVRLYDRAITGAEVDSDMEAPVRTPKTGPVAAYSFDEGSGERAADLTGDGHTATIHGAKWTTHGKYGGAMEFDAEDEDFVSIPASTALDGGEELTVEAWVRPDVTTKWGTILMKEREGSGPAYSFALYKREDRSSGYFDESEEGVLGSPEHSLPSRAWTHLAITDDGLVSRLYVDGALVDTKPALPIEGHGEIRIGGNAVWGQFFDGRIDELRIYDRSLDGAEVAADMETPLQTPKSAPVAAFSFDEGEGEAVSDVTGHGHTATIHGATWTTHGKYGGAMEFDAAGHDHLSVPDSPELDFTEEFTLEAWVRPDGENYWAPVVGKEIGGGYGKYELAWWLFEGGWAADVPFGGAEEPTGEEAQAQSEEALPQHTWSHLALTWDGSKVRLYVDGRLVDEKAGVPPGVTEGNLVIGGGEEYGGYFDGRIDELRIYSRALDAAEVGTDMEAPIQTPRQGPIAAWSFDEGEGTTAEDVTGDGHEGTIEGAEWVRGKYGDALRFDGAGDVVKVPNSPEFALTEAFTLEAWVRPESESNRWAPILAKEMGGGKAATELAWWLYESDWERDEPYGGTEPQPGEENYAASDDPLPVDAWSHVALTWDGSKVRLYVNGELVDCSPVAPAGAPRVTEGEVQIGAVTEHGDHFLGRIDEVRIYNRGLSQAEIAQSMYTTFPVAVTAAPEEVGSNDAFMTGTASVHGPEAEYFFEYGPTASYDAIADGEEITGDGEEIQLEEAAVNLAPEQTYHYRLVVESPLGTSYGKDKTFTTGPRTISVQEEEEENAPAPSAQAALTSEAQDEGKNPFFGVDWSGDLVEMEKQGMFARIAESGAEYVRFGVDEGEPGLRQAFAAAKANGLVVVPYIGESAPQPGDEKLFQFAKRIIEEFGPSYGNDYWEIGNEPNRPPLENEKEANARDMRFAQYYEEMYNYIKSAGDKVSGLKFLSPGLYGFRGGRKGKQSPQRFLQVFNADIALPNPYSAISVHPYVFEVRNPAKLKASPGYCPHPRTAAHKPVSPCDYEQVAKDMEGTVKKSRRADPGMQIWVTEYGFPVESHEKGIPSFGYGEQAALVKESSWRLFRRRKHLHLDHAMIYNIQDNYKFEFGKGPKWAGHSGLFDPQAQPRPSWKSFEQVVGQH